jgi:hypothetical protein
VRWVLINTLCLFLYLEWWGAEVGHNSPLSIAPIPPTACHEPSLFVPKVCGLDGVELSPIVGAPIVGAAEKEDVAPIVGVGGAASGGQVTSSFVPIGVIGVFAYVCALPTAPVAGPLAELAPIDAPFRRHGSLVRSGSWPGATARVAAAGMDAPFAVLTPRGRLPQSLFSNVGVDYIFTGGR